MTPKTTTCASQSGSQRRARFVGGPTSPTGASEKNRALSARLGEREQVIWRPPLIRRRCRSWLPGFLLGSVRGWDFGPRGGGRRNPRKGEPSPNGLIEIAALGGRAQQGFVHFPGNAQILIESSTEKFQLQHLAGFVVDNRREGGRLYGGNAHARFLLGRVARKSPSGRRGRASVRDAAGGARRCAVLRRCSLPRPDATS